jgi:hypothetical protein
VTSPAGMVQTRWQHGTLFGRESLCFPYQKVYMDENNVAAVNGTGGGHRRHPTTWPCCQRVG